MNDEDFALWRAARRKCRALQFLVGYEVRQSLFTEFPGDDAAHRRLKFPGALWWPIERVAIYRRWCGIARAYEGGPYVAAEYTCLNESDPLSWQDVDTAVFRDRR